MDFIKQNLGPNKVSVSIIPNYLEEDSLMVEMTNTHKNVYKKLDDMLEVCRSFKNTVTDPLATFIYFTFIEPSSLTYKIDDKNDQVVKFKTTLIKNLTNETYRFYKKLELNKLAPNIDDVISSIQDEKKSVEDRKLFLTYISRLIGKSLIVDIGEKEDKVVYATLPMTKGVLIQLKNEDIHNDYRFSIIDNNVDVVSYKKHRYLKDNLVETIDTLLLDKLRTIAEDLEIKTYKLVDGKKKYLLKNELKEVLNNHIKI
jgi:hypothetical protein